MENIIIREPRTKEQIDKAYHEMVTFNVWMSAVIIPEQNRLKSIVKDKTAPMESRLEAAIHGRALCDLVEKHANDIKSLSGFQNENDMIKWLETYGDLYFHED